MGRAGAKEIRSKQRADLLPKMPTAQRDPVPPAKPKPAAPERKRRGTSTRGGQAKKKATTILKKKKVIGNFTIL